MSTIEETLLNIADACDGACSSDAKGFNKLDAPKGNELATKVRAGKKLTAAERGIAYTLLKTYKKQLARNGIDYGSIEKPTKEGDQPEKDEYQQEIEAELTELEKYKQIALKILVRGNPLKYILNTYNKIHIGDRDAGEIQFISFGCQAANNTDGVHVNWVGPSGKGKSDGARACHHLQPKIYVLKGSVTAKSLYYHTDLPDGISVLLDDTDVKEGGDLEATVKRAITAYQEGTYHETLDGNRHLQRMKLPKRVAWTFTYVDVADSGDQFLNRIFAVKTASSKDADEKVYDHIMVRAETGSPSLPLTKRVMICKAMFWDIKNRPPYNVVVPNLRNIVSFTDKSNRRNPVLFADMVRGLVCIRHRQRKREQIGDQIILYADLEDIQEAARIFNEQSGYLTSRMDESERQIVEILKAAGRGGLTISGLATALMQKYLDDKWSEKKVRRLLLGEKGRSRSGLIEKIGGIEVEEDPRTDDEGRPIPGGRGVRRYCLIGDAAHSGEVVIVRPLSSSVFPVSPPFPQGNGERENRDNRPHNTSLFPNSPIEEKREDVVWGKGDDENISSSHISWENGGNGGKGNEKTTLDSDSPFPHTVGKGRGNGTIAKQIQSAEIAWLENEEHFKTPGNLDGGKQLEEPTKACLACGADIGPGHGNYYGKYCSSCGPKLPMVSAAANAHPKGFSTSELWEDLAVRGRAPRKEHLPGMLQFLGYIEGGTIWTRSQDLGSLERAKVSA